jgi:uncharacterized protein (DUF983 family)
MDKPSIWTGIRRGLGCRCPVCGEGRLFSSFLKVRPQCEICGADNTIYPSDDFPPYLTIIIVGHVVIPLFMWVDFRFEPSMWLQAAIWLPLTVIMSLGLLPSMKGATIGLCWAANIVREEVKQRGTPIAATPLPAPGPGATGRPVA